MDLRKTFRYRAEDQVLLGVKGTSLEDADQKEADLGAAVMAMVDKMM